MYSLSVHGRILLGRDLVTGTLVVRDGRIDEILRGPYEAALDAPHPLLETAIVAPGFIDLQVNGGFGVEVGADADALRHLAACLPGTGVTAYLPTAITAAPDFYPRLFAAFAAARGAPGARALGLHLEGPFLSPARKGAHRQDLIEGADPALFDLFLHSDAVRLVTVAPERPGMLAYIRHLRERNVLVSLGHTDADYEGFVRGVDMGARMATHVYNAMSPFEHRAPGAIGAARLDDRVTVGLIADGIHSHAATIRLALHVKGPDRVALVTDMMSGTGLSPGTYSLGGRPVYVDHRAARRADGTLAGSILTLDQAVRNVVRWGGVTPADALRMASEIPARLLGLEYTGRVVVGAKADLVLLDEDLYVTGTIIGGQHVYEKERA